MYSHKRYNILILVKDVITLGTKLKTKHSRVKYIVIISLVLTVLSSSAFAAMYFTKTLFFAVQTKSVSPPKSSPQASGTAIDTSQTSIYKAAIPTLSEQADADYQKTLNGSSN